MKNIKQSAKAVRQFVTVEQKPEIVLRLTPDDAAALYASIRPQMVEDRKERAVSRKIDRQLDRQLRKIGR